MGLLDVLAKSPPQDARASASMVFYGRESFYVEHHAQNRGSQWRQRVEAALEAGRFGVIAVGCARPGELESQLIERFDRAASQGLLELHGNQGVVKLHGRAAARDLIVTEAEYQAAYGSASVKTLKTTAEAFAVIVDALNQCDQTPFPWDKLKVLILSDVITTWDFDRLIDRLLENHEVPQTTLPAGTAPELLTRYEQARESAVKEFGLLRSEDLARAIHSTAENVSLVASKWRRKGEIFAVNYGGKPGYFAFQFDPVTGRPKSIITQVIQTFPPHTDGWRLALWLTSANPRLGHRRPVDLLDSDPEQVIEAAKGESRVELF
jgi:hypothetical protein